MNLFSPKSRTGLALIQRSSTAEQEIRALEQQLLALQLERDDAQRRAAIYKENFLTVKQQLEENQKRSKRELAELEPSLRKKLFKEQIVPLLDELHRTMLYSPNELWKNPWFQGFTLTIRSFEGMVRQWGINIYRGKGQTFDAHNFEAVLTEVHPELAEGTIIRTLLPGYWFVSDNQIIRRAQVVVSIQQRD